MILRPHLAVLALTTVLTLTACAATTPRAASNGTPVPKPAAAPAAVPAPFPSTYVAPATTPTLIKGATVLTGTGKRLERTDVLLRDGKIAAIGVSLSADANTRVIDGKNKWVTPGIIDVHSHLGVYPSPGVQAHQDGNEATAPSTANVWAEHSIWPQDPGFTTALEIGRAHV